ncbi:hypothetical protein MLD38_030373 [Melastoma candidum]|uniref:Uncharacterized protein n=1 Tax=Melastoma candidum TaxID=119954 RepID=A0ACB9MQ17_9MYRT|nr:hypothetical protein MLD38_030373 [Melastoma candidum]
MASRIRFLSVGVVLVIALVACVLGLVGAIECEDLDEGSCAFAVSSSGKRCLLEKRVKANEEGDSYFCESSRIGTDIGLKDHVETDSCIESCGFNRRLLGISSDALLESRDVRRLCSFECYYNCPNIIDLYFSLAAGEGVFLPKLCEWHNWN